MKSSSIHCETKPFRWQIWMQNPAKNEVSDMNFQICLESVLIHSRWSKLVPKHPPGPKKCFLTTKRPQNNFNIFFSKFEVCSSKWVFGILFQTSSKNTFWWPSENLTCLSIFIFRSNVARGAKYGTISNFLSYGFAIQGLLLKKFHFSTFSCEKPSKSS